MKIRHWKERFDPSRDFVYTCRMKSRLGPVGPGDPVNKGSFGAQWVFRLRILWESRRIALAPVQNELRVVVEPTEPVEVEEVEEVFDTEDSFEMAAEQAATTEEPVAPEEPADEKMADGIYPAGGSWYLVVVGDQTKKVNGKAAAQAAFEEMSK